MTWAPCGHRTFEDFTTRRDNDGELLWKCSDCGIVALWSEGWTYYGNIECAKCWTARIDRVYCAACAKKAPAEGIAAANAESEDARRELVAKARQKVARAKEKLDEAEQALAFVECEVSP